MKLNRFRTTLNIEGLYDYIVKLSTQRDSRHYGVQARKILEHYGYPSVESIKRNYLDRLYDDYRRDLKSIS